MKQKMICMMILLVIFTGVKVYPDDFFLIKNGKPCAKIIIRENASEKEKNAANELQYYIEKMSNVKLDIMTDSEKTSDPKILIGTNSYLNDFNLKIEHGDYPVAEKILIKTMENDLVLAGNDAGPYQGTLFSVYTFLELLGCRWFAPGELWEVVPKKDIIFVSKNLNIEEQPSFIDRSGVWYGHSSPDASKELVKWKLHNRCNTFSFSGGHAISGYVGKNYFQDHPEYFPLVNGERKLTQVCYTDDEVVNIIVEKLKNYFDKNPKVMSASLSENDTNDYCECDKCRKIGGTGTDRISRAQLYFLNRIAGKIKETHPDKTLVFMAYRTGQTAEPPIGMKAENNLLVSITSYAVFLGFAYCYSHPINDPVCPIAARARKLCDDWSNVIQKLRWSEHINDYESEMSRPYVHCSKINIPYLKSKHFIGYLEQSSIHSWLSMGPHNYVVAKLLWDSNLESDKLIEEYYQLLYGKSSYAVKCYYNALTAALLKHPHMGHSAEILPDIFEETLPVCEQHLREAEKMTDSEIIKKRVKHLVDYFGLLKRYCEMIHAVRKWQKSNLPHDREDAIQKIAGLKQFGESIKDEKIIDYLNFQEYDIKKWENFLKPSSEAGIIKIKGCATFAYNDDYNYGGKAKVDSKALSGFDFSQYGLCLPPGTEGKIVYQFNTSETNIFRTVKVKFLTKNNPALENAVEISIDNGKTFYRTETSPGRQTFLDISEYCKDKKSFQLRFYSKYKKGLERILVLDSMEIQCTLLRE